MNYTYETNVIVKFSSLVPSLTQYIVSVSPRSWVQIWLWVQFKKKLNIMFKLHCNETVNYTYETKVIVNFSSLVPSLTHFMVSGSLWCNG